MCNPGAAEQGSANSLEDVIRLSGGVTLRRPRSDAALAKLASVRPQRRAQPVRRRATKGGPETDHPAGGFGRSAAEAKKRPREDAGANASPATKRARNETGESTGDAHAATPRSEQGLRGAADQKPGFALGAGAEPGASQPDGRACDRAAATGPVKVEEPPAPAPAPAQLSAGDRPRRRELFYIPSIGHRALNKAAGLDQTARCALHSVAAMVNGLDGDEDALAVRSRRLVACETKLTTRPPRSGLLQMHHCSRRPSRGRMVCKRRCRL